MTFQTALARVFPAVVVTVVALVPRPASAQSDATHVTEWRTQLSVAINNLGAQQSLEWSRRRLLAPEAGPMRAEAHWQFGTTMALTPSFARVGMWAQVAPVSMLVVRAGVEPAFYFGTFNSLMTFDHRADRFDTDTRKARGGATAGTAVRWYVSPTVRARLGRFVAMASADLERWSASVDGPLMYEPTRDTLIDPDGESVIGLRHLVLYEHVRPGGSTVAIGGMHTLQRVHGFRNAELNQIQKLGAVFSFQAADRVARLVRPNMVVTVARYLDDPSKQRGWTASVSLGISLRRRAWTP